MTPETIEPLFPWFEANQGFLSFLALVAAFGIALYEFRRAERLAVHTKDDDVGEVLSVIDSVFRVARGVRENFVDPKYVPRLVRSLNRDMKLAARDLEIVALKCSSIDLVTTINRAAERFKSCESRAATFEELEVDIREIEEKFSADRKILLDHHLPPFRRQIRREIEIERMQPRLDNDVD